MNAPDFSTSRIGCELDFTHPGKRVGAMRMAWSLNENPLVAYPIPVMAVVGEGPGPTVLMIGGVHGDEYEEPIALSRLYRALDPAALAGRVIFLAALNAPAVREAARVSPLDNANLNRAFLATRMAARRR